MDSRELVQLAKALTRREGVGVSSLTLTVEKDGVLKDFVLRSNGDLFRPLHIGDRGFDDADDALDFVEESHARFL